MGTLPSMGSCDMALSEKDSAGFAVGHSAQLIEARLQQENVALREEVDNASMFEEIVDGAPALTALLLRVSNPTRWVTTRRRDVGKVRGLRGDQDVSD